MKNQTPQPGDGEAIVLDLNGVLLFPPVNIPLLVAQQKGDER